MGRSLSLGTWRVVTRDEGCAPGDPRTLVDPAGRRHDVLEILRRRLVATTDPAAPIYRELEVRSTAGVFLLTWTMRTDEWQVQPVPGR